MLSARDITQAAVALDSTAEEGQRPYVAIAMTDDAARAKYLRASEPWVGRTSEAGEYWRAVERVAMQVEP